MSPTTTTGTTTKARLPKLTTPPQGHQMSPKTIHPVWVAVSTISMDNNNNNNNNLLPNNNNKCIQGNLCQQYQCRPILQITSTPTPDGVMEVFQILTAQKVVRAQLHSTNGAEAAQADFEPSKLHSLRQTRAKISSFGLHTFCQHQERTPNRVL